MVVQVGRAEVVEVGQVGHRSSPDRTEAPQRSQRLTTRPRSSAPTLGSPFGFADQWQASGDGVSGDGGNGSVGGVGGGAQSVVLGI